MIMMSPILEAQEGDEIVCIGEFYASPHGEGFTWESSRMFHIGERVRYAGFYRDEHSKDRPTGWMVLFDVADGTRYHGTQTFFVTVDCWRNLERFFRSALAQGPHPAGSETDGAKTKSPSP
jgi:hypothetical protein